MKLFVGIIAVILTFVGYVPYIRDTIAKKTTPHIYTWFAWGLASAVTFALQITAGAGAGSFVSLAAMLVCFFIFSLSLRNGNRDIAIIDTVSLMASLLALGAWLIVKDPVISVILIAMSDILSFAPTIRKSWNKPYQETLSSYAINTIRFALTIYALNKLSVVTALYPVFWLVTNGLFCVYITARRRYYPKPKML